MATRIVAGLASPAPAKIPTALSEALAEARAKALDDAANEITAIAQTLQVARQHSAVEKFDALLPGALMRLELLGTCVGILADSRTDADEVALQFEYVTGVKLEADHA